MDIILPVVFTTSAMIITCSRHKQIKMALLGEILIWVSLRVCACARGHTGKHRFAFSSLVVLCSRGFQQLLALKGRRWISGYRDRISTI